MFQALVALAVVGATQIYNSVKAKDYESVVTIAVAAVVGLLVGVFHQFGLDWFTGLTLGLSAVGVHTVTKNIG